MRRRAASAVPVQPDFNFDFEIGSAHVHLCSDDTMNEALVAQLDRATGFEPVGRGFESLRAHQLCFSRPLRNQRHYLRRWCWIPANSHTE